MKQRVISSAVGLSILAFVFICFDTIVLNIAIAIIIVMALRELISAGGYAHSGLSLIAICFGATIPFFKTSLINQILPLICFAFSLVLFCYLLKHHKTVTAVHVGFVFFFTIIISFSATSFVYLRDFFGMQIGFYGVIVALCGAWMSDTGAYFFGIAFGKRKLAPEISPKKTVEGFLGGILVALISQLFLAFIYETFGSFFGINVNVNYLLVAICSPFISILSVLGDLTASVLKRQFKIKDFGNIMPGHGGVLDRFDSVLMVVPFVYILFLFLPIVTMK